MALVNKTAFRRASFAAGSIPDLPKLPLSILDMPGGQESGVRQQEWWDTVKRAIPFAVDDVSRRVTKASSSFAGDLAVLSSSVTEEAETRATTDDALASNITAVEAAYQAADDTISASVTTEATARADADGAIHAHWGVRLNANGRLIGRINLDGTNGTSTLDFEASTIRMWNGTAAVAPFLLSGGTLFLQNLVVDGSIVANGSISTSKLDFTPVETSNVVASINATAEGIRIAGDRITLNGDVSFATGYDPTGKVASGGAATDVNANSTTISGAKIRSGLIESNNWGTAAGSQYDLDNGTFKLGGSSDPALSWDGSTLRIGGVLETPQIEFGAEILADPASAEGAELLYRHPSPSTDSWHTDIDSNGNFRIFNDLSTADVIELGTVTLPSDVECSRDLYVARDIIMSGTGYGDFTTFSSRQLKKNIRPMEGVLDRVRSLEPVRFSWRANVGRYGRANQADVGLIAEDVAALFPEIVVTDRTGVPAVNYAKAVTLVWGAIRELADAVDQLKAAA